MILRVIKVTGEPTRFHVESHALQCISCGKMVDRVRAECTEFSGRQRALLRKIGVWARVHEYVSRREGQYKVGDPCPKCGADLDVHFWLVDIASYNLNGACGCEHFRFALEPELKQQPPEYQGMGNFRCSHIDAARDFALDVSLKAHEYWRLKKANGRREEDQP